MLKKIKIKQGNQTFIWALPGNSYLCVNAKFTRFGVKKCFKNFKVTLMVNWSKRKIKELSMVLAVS